MPVNMKQVIAQTFAQMVEEKGLDEVTVKSLVEACNISRQTFYYHFQDIIEVIEWSLDQALDQALGQTLEAKSMGEEILVLVESTVEKREMINALLNSQRREQMELMFLKAIRTYLKRLLEARSPQLPINYSDMELLLDFWSCGLTGILLKLCRQKQIDEKKLSEQIARLLSRRMVDLSGQA